MIIDVSVYKSIQLSLSHSHTRGWTQLFGPVGLILIVEQANETWHGKTYPFLYEPETPLSVSSAFPFDLMYFLGNWYNLFILLKAIWASSLSPPPLFIVIYFLAWARLNSKYLVDIVTRQIKAHQQNNEMISAYGYSLQRLVSLIYWETESHLPCNTFKSFAAVRVHTFYMA